MSRIHVLSDHVANQIAAGEVVERPVAVVKELVENALDAGADRIEVEARRGGKSLIRVSDNGAGMTPAEARLSLRRHATSKIAGADDLLRIASFGFRGEALPSIASVSDFTLRSRCRGSEEGGKLRVEHGKLVEERAEALPEGTSIEVARLFNTVPARRKFLKTDRTEAAHIVQVVRLFALAHPAVGFRLRIDGRDVLSSPPCGGLEERVSEIWGKQMLADTLPFERRAGPLFLYGRLGKPPLSRATRQDLVCIVNGRPVETRTIQYGILEACTGFLPKGRYPVAFFFLEIPPEAIDVNVHPTKREIRFRDEPRVRRVVVETVLDLLLDRRTEAADGGGGLFPAPESGGDRAPRTESSGAPGGGTIPRRDEGRGDRPSPPPEERTGQPPFPAPEGSSAGPAPPPEGSAPGTPVPPPAKGADTGPAWQWVGPFGASTILFRSPRGLVLFHPRAASERILYEQYLAESEGGRIQTQGLLIPQTFEWEPLPARCLEENRETFAGHGFEVESFGKNFFRVSAVPAWFEPSRAEGFLRDAVALIREGTIRPEKAGPFRERLARLAAANAHRRDRRLTEEEALRLVRRLLRTSTPHSCPAGKPTFLEFESGELERRFGRSL